MNIEVETVHQENQAHTISQSYVYGFKSNCSIYVRKNKKDTSNTTS